MNLNFFGRDSVGAIVGRGSFKGSPNRSLGVTVKSYLLIIQPYLGKINQ